MKFSLSWLKTHLQTDAALAEITDTLTRIGLELEGVEDRGAALAAFRIARVVEAVQHPNADRLRVCKVDTGDDMVFVVCGAPNARTGMKGVFAAPGSFIPGTGTTLKVGEIRGVRSAGMLLSAREMGLGDDHSGIVDLPDDAPVGVPYAQWAGLDDPVIDVSVTPNRGDCFSVRGIARDLAAAGIGTLKPWQPANAQPRSRSTGSIRRPALADRLARGLPVDPRPHHPQRAERRQPAMAAGPADLDRSAADQRAGRRHQFLHRRSRPAAARVRRRQTHRRRADAAARARRDVPRAERQGLHGRRRRTARSPMRPACSRWPA